MLALFGTVLIVLASQPVSGAPWNRIVRHTTHNTHTLGPRGTKFKSYHPEPVFETYGVMGVDHPLTKRGVAGTPQDAAKAFLEEKLGITSTSFSRKSGHKSDVVSHEYFVQQINGISVVNAVANVGLKGKKVVSFGYSFRQPKSIAASTPKLTQNDSVTIAESAAGGKYNGVPVSLQYFAQDSDHLTLVHIVQIQNNKTGEWYEVYVDAGQGQVVNVISFLADAKYRVIPLTLQDPTDGFRTVTDPYDSVSSPNGWHQYGSMTTTSTSGNNVVAYRSSPDNGTSVQTSSPNNYEYIFDSKSLADATKDASTVNAFYLGNMMHDLLYRYGTRFQLLSSFNLGDRSGLTACACVGFTETAYNFQRNNGNKGGQENDPVLISVQDASGTDNANFVTPPDGQPGQMRMFMWTKTVPPRDGALENDIVVHEYAHGLSNRLTGGGTGLCLQSIEAQGLGEGWSDAVADWTEQTDADDVAGDFTMGTYVNMRAIREYPYSTSMITNPLTYSSLRSRIEVHDAGEVWAEMWHEIYALLVDKHGFSSNKNDSNGTGGNIAALHLLVDGLQLQPCNPTVIAARDAVIQADANRYNGTNKCLLWTAFAKRGLGVQASTAKFDDFTMPAEC
ncbi:hypothetical protein FRC07_008836 [Ceratobasidium sp. 392]|nr:hypothetical protein FRC07_008836 [Ceratobasidium sp. 392]